MGTLSIPTCSQDHKSPDPALTPFSSLNAGISTTCSSVSFICKMGTLIPPYLPHTISLRLKWSMVVKVLWRQRNVFIRSNSILEGCMRGKVVKLGRLNKSHPILWFYKIVLYYFVIVTRLCPPLLQPCGLWPTRLLCPWNSLGKNTGVGCHSFLPGIFPTLELNPRLLLGRWILYHWATRKALYIP